MEVKEIGEEERGRTQEGLQKFSGIYCLNGLSYAKMMNNEKVMPPSLSCLNFWL